MVQWFNPGPPQRATVLHLLPALPDILASLYPPHRLHSPLSRLRRETSCGKMCRAHHPHAEPQDSSLSVEHTPRDLYHVGDELCNAFISEGNRMSV